MRATLQEEAAVRAHGYKVAPLDCGTGAVPNAWTLTDPDGAFLMIGEHGGVSPTRWEAVAEGLARIEETEA